jgi:hypothetical protein
MQRQTRGMFGGFPFPGFPEPADTDTDKDNEK